MDQNVLNYLQAAPANPFDQFDGHQQQPTSMSPRYAGVFGADAQVQQPQAAAPAAQGNPFDQFDGQTNAGPDSAVSSGARNFLHDFTLGLSEPLVAAVQSTVGDPTNPTSHAADWSARYHENLAALNQGARADEEAHPVASTVGGLAGAFTSPINKVVGPIKSLGGAARAGAVYGLYSGAGDAFGQDEDAAGIGEAGLEGMLGGAATGGALHKVGGAVADFMTPRTAPLIAALKKAAQEHYQKLENSGVLVGTDALNALGDSAADKFGDVFADPEVGGALYPKASAALKLVSSYGTEGKRGASPVSFSDLDKMRQVVADATSSIEPKDKYMARQILDHVDNFVSGLGPQDLDTTALDAARSGVMSATGQVGALQRGIKSIEQNQPGALAARGAAGAGTRQRYMDMHKSLTQAQGLRQDALDQFNAEQQQVGTGAQQAINDLKLARGFWKRYAKASQLQAILNKAGNNGTGFAQAGYENAIRTGFRKLANNDRGMAGFSPEERAAITQVATGGSNLSATNLLRQVGKLSPQGAVPILAEAGMYLGGGAPTLALPAAGFAARMGATALQKRAALRAIDLAATGPAGAAVLNTRAAPVALPRALAMASARSLPRLMPGAIALAPSLLRATQ